MRGRRSSAMNSLTGPKIKLRTERRVHRRFRYGAVFVLGAIILLWSAIIGVGIAVFSAVQEAVDYVEVTINR